MWEVLCGHYSGNPSVRRRGRRAVAQTSKHILLFVIDPLSIILSLSLSLSLSYTLHYFILFIHTYMLGIVCVPHLC